MRVSPSRSCLVTFARAGVGNFLATMAGGRQLDHPRGTSLPRILPAKNFKGKATNRHPTPKSKFAGIPQFDSNPTQRLHHGSRRNQKVIRHSHQKNVELSILTSLAARRNGPRTLTTPPGPATPTHSGTRSYGPKAGRQANTWEPRTPRTQSTTAQRTPPTSAPC